jgi:hypothetical protein
VTDHRATAATNRGDINEEETVTDADLRAILALQIDRAFEANNGETNLAALKQALKAFVDDGVTQYRAAHPLTNGVALPEDTSAYDNELGRFIIQQNPYCARDQLVLPKLPTDADSETRWVRKSGLLSEYTAQKPWDPKKTIPAGPIVDFPYVDWPHLREVKSGAPNPGAPGGTAETFISVDTPDTIDATLDNYKEYRPGTPPPYPWDHSEFYPHHAVKTVRLRYTFKDRRRPLPPDPPLAEGVLPDDREAGYILIIYSGSDS